MLVYGRENSMLCDFMYGQTGAGETDSTVVYVNMLTSYKLIWWRPMFVLIRQWVQQPIDKELSTVKTL